MARRPKPTRVEEESRDLDEQADAHDEVCPSQRAQEDLLDTLAIGEPLTPRSKGNIDVFLLATKSERRQKNVSHCYREPTREEPHVLAHASVRGRNV